MLTIERTDCKKYGKLERMNYVGTIGEALKNNSTLVKLDLIDMNTEEGEQKWGEGIVKMNFDDEQGTISNLRKPECFVCT